MIISWSATGSMLSGIGSILGAIAIIVGAILAAWTATRWKKQRIDERRFEHAERCLEACYLVREAIQTIRSPMIFSIEQKKAREELEGDPEFETVTAKDKHIFCQTLIERIKSTETAWEKLSECTPLAKALFEDRLEIALSELHRQRWVLRTWIDAHLDDDGSEQEFSRKIRRELFSTKLDDESMIGPHVLAQIAEIERICLPSLRSNRAG